MARGHLQLHVLSAEFNGDTPTGSEVISGEQSDRRRDLWSHKQAKNNLLTLSRVYIEHVALCQTT
jgi:hypothetical protein